MIMPAQVVLLEAKKRPFNFSSMVANSYGVMLATHFEFIKE